MDSGDIPRDETQVIKLGSKYLYPLSHLGDPCLTIFGSGESSEGLLRVRQELYQLSCITKQELAFNNGRS